ncbi:hypothetical protein ABW20_dc0106184 [Dactylellina cionopaga]|nr:hypothetical protein ABW20_dc0106184 [Dactylellina cionopaga]
MVSAKAFSIALCCGVFGRQAYAGPVALNDATLDALDTASRGYFDRRATPAEDGIKLLPVREDDLFPQLRKRAANDLSRLDLRKNVTMIYQSGQTPENQQYYSKVTVQQPDADHPLILMEKFDTLTKSVICNDQDRKITLTFNDQAAMDYAIKAWDWINQDDKDYFYLIANHKDCGPDEERAPYKIDGVKYTKESLTAVLTSTQSVDWAEAAKNFDLNLASTVSAKTKSARRRSIAKRGFWSWVIDAVDMLTQNTIGRIFDLSSLDLEHETDEIVLSAKVGDENNRISLFSDGLRTGQDKRFEVACVGCYLSGGFGIKGALKIRNGLPREVLFMANPKDIKGKLEIEVVTRGKIPVISVSEPIAPEIPITPFVIPGFARVGPAIVVKVKGDVEVQLVANMSIGISMNVPNEAGIVTDFISPEKSAVFGWDKVSFDPFQRINHLGLGKVEGSVAFAPELSFGVSLLNSKIKFDVAMEILLPKLALTGQAGFKDGGFCDEDKSTNYGAQIESGIGIEFWAKAGFTEGLGILTKVLSGEWNLGEALGLGEIKKTFFTKCYPIKGAVEQLEGVDKAKRAKHRRASLDAPRSRKASKTITLPPQSVIKATGPTAPIILSADKITVTTPPAPTATGMA